MLWIEIHQDPEYRPHGTGRHKVSTAIIGKWGLGSMNSTGAPGKQGFDFFYGYNDQNHAHNHYPSFLWRNDKIEKLDNPVINVHPKFDKNATHDLQEYKQYK